MSEKKARQEPEVRFPERGGGEAQTEGHPPAGDPRAETPAAGADEDSALQQQESLVEQVARLEAESVEFRDKWTRALAEAENVRRRAERDRRDAEAYGGTRLARDLLTVYDNLERALKAADDELRAQHGPFIEGVELTRRELLNAFAKHRIEKVTPERGEKFDPNRHQAMFEAPVPDAEPGTIIETMQDGFVIADRLLRPALVGVARAAPQAPAEEAARPEGAEPGQDDGIAGGGDSDGARD